MSVIFSLSRLLSVIGLVLTLVSPASAQSPQTILVIGDSLTAGYGLPQEDSFPAALESHLQEMGRNVTVRNGGVSGDTTAGGRARLAWALNPRPDVVILELGANDALRGLPPQHAFTNLKAMIKTLQKQKIPVLLAGMKAPRNYGPEYAAEFDGIYPRLAQETGVLLYPFFMEEVFSRPEMLQPDGLHPTAKGVQLIVAAILPDVLAVLDRDHP